MSGIIIAGGCGILGQAVVRRLVAQGARVGIVDFVAGEANGAECLIAGCDLADECQVSAAYASLADRFGGAGGLVNVAGGFLWELAAQGSVDSWDKMYRMNLRTAISSIQAALPLLSDGASIVNVGAAAAQAPGAGMAPYAASKAGVVALTLSLAEELRSRQIRVNAVLPTIIDTPTNRADMPDADRSDWVSPEAAASVITFLLSDDSACVTGASVKLASASVSDRQSSAG